MKMLRNVIIVLSALISGCWVPAALSQGPVRDGSRDFDFNIGTWKSYMVRLKAPLSGSRDTIALHGTVTTSKIWGGAGQYEEIELDGPTGHWQGLTIFLYSPASGQWSQSFVNSASGELQPAMVGQFQGGRGELYAQDTFRGRSILVRGVWSDIRPDSHSYEEAYSPDGGNTWETVLSAKLTRTTPVPPPPPATPSEGGHDFEFDHGLWRTQTSRLVKPLSGSNQWFEMEGTTRVTPIWSGRANLAEFEADGAGKHLELISLRLYNPTTKQWSLHFATRGEGKWSVPMIGEFKDGKGSFYDQEDFGGRMILVRFNFINISPNEARSEQAFSADGGKTWETNWINRYTRLPAESGRARLSQQ